MVNFQFAVQFISCIPILQLKSNYSIVIMKFYVVILFIQLVHSYQSLRKTRHFLSHSTIRMTKSKTAQRKDVSQDRRACPRGTRLRPRRLLGACSLRKILRKIRRVNSGQSRADIARCTSRTSAIFALFRRKVVRNFSSTAFFRLFQNWTCLWES